MKSGLVVNADIINNILCIYNLHVTDEVLNNLINIPQISFGCLSKDLTKDLQFKDKLGVANRPVAGVYIFTPKWSGVKYVGSSTELATRLGGYLRSTHKEYGKFIPFLAEEGLSKFTLGVMSICFSTILKPELVLEQYFLLDPSFNLNTSRVANIPHHKSREMYMYNKDKTILIYHNDITKNFLTKFGISRDAIIGNIETGKYYLGNYVFSPVPILTAGKYSYKEVQ